MTPLLSDARLARQATEGDRRAFDAIYKRYHQDLYRFCLSIVGRPDDAQDALQNTMVKALRSLPGEKREIQLKPWLYRVAHNESVDLLRRRREGPELDASRAGGAAEITETVALRERLERLLADLDALPERQRSALVMRELSDLGYEQIGEALDTSVSTARQTVYEARLNLRELEAGREMRCDRVTRQLSEADGRVTRRRDIQAHLRACPDCRAFRDSIGSRRQDLAALSPLPAAVTASILHGVVGGQAASGLAGTGATASGVGIGAGKIAASSATLKAVATVAVVATVGVTAADRSNLIDAGLPGDSGGGTQLDRRENDAGMTAPSAAAANDGAERARIGLAGRPESGRVGSKSAPAATRSGGDENDAGGNPGSSSENRTGNGSKSSPGPPTTLPEASRHGQETAAAHKANGGSGSGKTRQAASSAPKASRGGGTKHHGPPAHAGPPDHAQGGGTAEVKRQPEAGSQPSESKAKADGSATGEAAAGADGKPDTSP